MHVEHIEDKIDMIAIIQYICIYYICRYIYIHIYAYTYIYCTIAINLRAAYQ